MDVIRRRVNGWGPARLAVGVAAVLVSSVAPARAQAPMRMLVSNGVKAAFATLVPGCQGSLGVRIAAEFGTTNALRAAAAGGAPFDVIVMTEEAVQDLAGRNVVAAPSVRPVAATRIGVGVRAGRATPDVRTPAALIAALRAARSVTYASDGASRPFIERMLDRLGIGAEVAAKYHPEASSTAGAARVVDGRTELLLTLVSEIVPVDGLRLAGELPAEFHGEVRFAAGAGRGAADPARASAVIGCLTARSAQAAYEGVGLRQLPPR